VIKSKRKLSNGKQKITTALLLAAGTGSRLQPLTDDAPKCLTEVNGTTILKRLIRSLQSRGFTRVVVVVGFLDLCVREALRTSVDGLAIEFIHSPRYRTTNNIYSLWLARQAIQEPFLLIESDLLFDTALLDDMLEPDRIAVSLPLPWMNGTTVTLDPNQQVTRFHVGSHRAMGERTYKTVNMYSFSSPSWQRVASRLDEYVSAGRVGEYYETVFAEMVAQGDLSFQAAFFDNEHWYEIDTLGDLYEAEKLFPAYRGLPTAPV
jgi:choline kinase